MDNELLREKMLRLREELAAVEERRLAGERGYSVDEVAEAMRLAVREAADSGQH